MTETRIISKNRKSTQEGNSVVKYFFKYLLLFSNLISILALSYFSWTLHKAFTPKENSMRNPLCNKVTELCVSVFVYNLSVLYKVAKKFSDKLRVTGCEV